MPVVSTLGAASSRGFGEFGAAATPDSNYGNYIEDIFSSYVYSGSATSQYIQNNIPFYATASWSTTYVNNYLLDAGENSFGVAIDSAGNAYSLGVYKNGAFKVDTFVVKYNSNNTLQWQKSLTSAGSTSWAKMYGIAADTSGNVYTTGYGASTGSISQYFGIVKFNTNGAIAWQRRLYNNTGTGISVGRSIAVDSSGNVYATGTVADGSFTPIATVKYNSSGAIQWQKKIQENNSNNSTLGGTGIAVDSLGNVYVCGVLTDDSSYRYVSFIKYDSSGNILIQKKLYTSTSDRPTGICLDSAGNIYIVCQFSGNRGGVIKLNSFGVVQYTKAFSVKISALYGICSDSSDNIYVCGTYNGFPGISSGFFAKINSSGSVQWQRNVLSPTGYWSATPGIFYGIAVDSSENLYVNGNFIIDNGQFYSTTLKVKTDGTTVAGYAGVVMQPDSIPFSDLNITSATVTGTNGDLGATSQANNYASGDIFTLNGTSTQAAVLSSNGGGMVWLKDRSTSNNHNLFDTIRGYGNTISSNTTNPQTFDADSLASFSTSGFEVGRLAAINTNGNNYISWTFSKGAKFFDVIQYTGTGANQTIAHNLGSVPGMIMVKRIDTTGNWQVYHNSLTSAAFAVQLNSINAQASDTTIWNSTAPTDTVFSVGTNSDVNAIGGQYIAYLYASNSGGFGSDNSQNIISCGTYTGNGSTTGPLVTLGYEPQFVMVKAVSTTGNWVIEDVMRNMSQSSSNELFANTSGADVALNPGIIPNATGFNLGTSDADLNASGVKYIYMAIRRGPMRTPTSGSTVFSPITDNAFNGTVETTGFVVDSQWKAIRSSSNALNTSFDDRLRGVDTVGASTGRYLITSSNAAEATTNGTTRAWTNTGFSIPSYYSGVSSVFWSFGRAPRFLDIVCYAGSGSTQAISHNLATAPELIIVKARNSAQNWSVYYGVNTNYLSVNLSSGASTDSTYWNNTSPTYATFTVGTNATVNGAGNNYVAYLFATCSGVSKIGTYTGTGATQTINCDFTGGARFVLIKRTDSTGDWYVWDTARGMISGTDPSLLLDTTAGEVNANSIYTTTGGFQIVSIDAGINALGGSYVFLAIS